MTVIRVLVCRVGKRPVVEELVQLRDGGNLKSMQAIVGGLLTCVDLGDGLDLWCNDDSLALGHPLNRVIPALAPIPPPGFDLIYMGEPETFARPGELGEWRIHGDFFIARQDGDGGVASVTDVDVSEWCRVFSDEDPDAAEVMMALRGDVHR